jgi:hypothetical protein
MLYSPDGVSVRTRIRTSFYLVQRREKTIQENWKTDCPTGGQGGRLTIKRRMVNQ